MKTVKRRVQGGNLSPQRTQRKEEKNQISFAEWLGDLFGLEWLLGVLRILCALCVEIFASASSIPVATSRIFPITILK